MHRSARRVPALTLVSGRGHFFFISHLTNFAFFVKRLEAAMRASHISELRLAHMQITGDDRKLSEEEKNSR